MSALRVGLTGGLASGKSTVADLLVERGARVIDADELVADLYRPGAAGTAAVQSLFGDEALTPDGSVDRAVVARRVFTDAEARRALEAAIHPLVRRRFEEVAADADGIVVLEATLLVEAGYGPGFRPHRDGRGGPRGAPAPGGRARHGREGGARATRGAG